MLETVDAVTYVVLQPVDTVRRKLLGELSEVPS
jgi:hypothetical protein